MQEDNLLVDVSKENWFQQLIDECGRKFNEPDLQIATLAQNVEGLTQASLNLKQGAVAPTGASDQPPYLHLQTTEKFPELGESVEDLEKNFASLDTDFGHFWCKIQGLEDN